MTDEEKYIAQGRARETAKKLQGEVATIRTSFIDYGEQLEGMKDLVARLLRDPVAKLGGDFTIPELMNRRQKALCQPDVWGLALEFATKTQKLRDLEEEIKNF